MAGKINNVILLSRMKNISQKNKKISKIGLTIKDMLDKGMIVDHGITEDLFDQFKKADQFDTTICKLQMMITNDLINPYLEENGLMDLRTPMVDDVVEESDEDDDEDSDEE